MYAYFFLIGTAFLINLPLGYFRGKAKKFSLAWFFWVHASIPFLIYLRIVLKISPWFIPVSILAAVLGQFTGSYLLKFCLLNMQTVRKTNDR